MDMDFLVALAQIMMVNIVLSGDNAVVIALAARNLPPAQQKKAAMWGSGGAIILRVVLTVVAVALLKIPFLQFFGALLLLWIAVKLLIEEDGEEGAGHEAHDNLFAAVKTILVADIVMSLDNTLAIAGVAKGNWTLLITGLVLSIPLIVFGSTISMKLIARFPIIVYIGAGLIAYTAGEMIESDKAVQPYLPEIFHGTPYLGLVLTVGVIAYGWWCNNRARQAHGGSEGRSLAHALDDDEEEHAVGRG